MRLLIQRDGMVLVCEHGEPDRELNKDDPLALASAFRAIVAFEEGLTSAQLFGALAPWAALLSRAAWIDFDAWLASVTPTPLRLVDASYRSGDEEPLLDAVVIHAVLTTHQQSDITSAPASLAINWQTSGRYATPQSNGFGGEDRFCSLSLSPPERWAYLPLIIDPTTMIDDLNAFFGVTVQPLLMIEPTFFETVVLGFLDDVSFHGTPYDLARVWDEMSEQIAAIKDGEAVLGEESRNIDK